MANTISLTENYGYTAYKASGLASGTLIKADTASWIHDNDAGDGKSNPYPVAVVNSPGVVLDGGTIRGIYSQTKDWADIYKDGNSAAIRTEGTPNIVIRDWRITDTWDAVRVSTGSQNFLIEDVWVTNARDDAVENDKLNSGTIRDSLFDGVLSGISLDPSSSSPVDGSDETVTIDGVLLRMKPFLIEGKVTHASPIKPDSANGATWTPKINITNTVFAIEDVDHNGYNRLTNAWKNLGESKNNVYLNLSDKPLPADYPAPPGGWGAASGWTLLQGQAARDYWNKAKATWIANHENGDSDPVPAPAPTPTPDPVPTPDPTPEPTNPAKGTSGSDTFTGTSGSDNYDALGGNDTLWGKDGNDVLTGGSGKDVFVFDTKPGAGNVDTITDFNANDDALYLDNAIFTKLGSGSLSSPQQISKSYFELREKAASSNDYLLYNKSAGVLSYDADGSGKGAAVEIAKFNPGTAITYNDVFII
jgi:Ca2+-binding RTX toxin-like protein